MRYRITRNPLVSALVFACGAACGTSQSDTTTSVAQNNPSDYPLALAAEADLPPCDAAWEGRLVYLKQLQEFRLCTANAWLAISLRGPQGMPGPAGLPGMPGSAGIDGRNGLDGINGQKGEDGAKGKDGVDGKDGKDATAT